MGDSWMMTVARAGELSGLGRTSIYMLIGQGRVKAFKSGKRTLLCSQSLRDYLASLPAADIHTGQKPTA